MNQKKLFEYILLRSLNMNSKKEKITPREIFELIRQTKKADELIIIYDFCAMEKGARFKLAGKKALEEAGKKNSLRPCILKRLIPKMVERPCCCIEKLQKRAIYGLL